MNFFVGDKKAIHILFEPQLCESQKVLGTLGQPMCCSDLVLNSRHI